MKRSCRPNLHCYAAALLALLGLLLPLRGAQAGAYTYNSGTSQRAIHAGIITLESTSNADPDPYVFYVLSQRQDVLPNGWSLTSPLAAQTSANGVTLTPASAAYWQVRLSRATADDIAQYDVLLLNLDSTTAQTVTFSAADSEKLRRFVDGGGTLWIEGNSNTTLDNITNTLFLDRINPPDSIAFGTGGTPPTPPSTGALPNGLPPSALLSTPYFLQASELATLSGGGNKVNLAGTPSSLLPLVLTYTSATDVLITAGTYGQGAVIISSTQAPSYINYGASPKTGTTYTDTDTYNGTLQPGGLPGVRMTPSLKLTADIIAWGGGHSGRASHQTGAAFDALASPVRQWNYGVSNGAGTPPSPLVYGSLTFVVDAGGLLHAFVTKPGTDISNPYSPATIPDAGLPTYKDYSKGASYDEYWHTTLGAGASAPVMFTDSSGSPIVLVEDSKGNVLGFNPANGNPASSTGFSSGKLTGSGLSGGPAFTATSPAPAPTVYNGVVYAVQTDGSLYSSTAQGDYAPVTAGGGTTVTPQGAAAVGIVPGDTPATGFAPQTNDILAFMPSTSYLYSIYLGTRGEQLHDNGTTVMASGVNTSTDFRTKLTGQAKVLATPGSTQRVYALQPGSGYINRLLPPPTTGTYSATLDASGKNYMTANVPVGTPLYADYDTNLTPGPSGSGTDLTRTQVGIANNPGSSSPPVGTLNGPALDRFGNAVYVTNTGSASSLVSFHDSPVFGKAILNWRFRLPTLKDGAVVDADGVDYTSGTVHPLLVGYTFQGAPVVDEHGVVYALASNGTNVAIVCINGLQPVTTGGVDQGTATVTQPVPVGGTMDEFGNSPSQIAAGQLPSSSGGLVTIQNFGIVSSGSPRSLYPNLSEPQSLTVTPNSGGGPAVELKLHTNLAWYSVLPANSVSLKDASGNPATLGGLTKAGGALFFVDGNGHLISVVADPVSAGIPIINKYVDAGTVGGALPPLFTNYGPTGVGASPSAPAIAGGALVVNGRSGIAGYANRVTLVADSTRLLELNSSGDATWAVDSTTGAPPGSTLAQSVTALNAGIAPSLELNRPTAVTELTANDYLVADTGNNRCVRFDRSGKTVWELSRVNDAYTGEASAAAFGKTKPLLAPGEPDTLNQPTSVQIYSQTLPVGTGTYTFVRYLISDTGNFRVLEVVDTFDSSTGAPVGTPHNLVWVSHTHDTQQRQYRYQSAAYFTTTSNTPSLHMVYYVVALVTNKRIPSLASGGTLSPANADAPGASIVLLNLLHNQGDPTDGMIDQAQSKFSAYLTGSTNTGYSFDIDTTARGTGTNPSTLFFRNPRYLKAYVPQTSTATVPLQSFLVADDNGVFDLQPSGQGLLAQWGFTQKDYQALTVPLTLAQVVAGTSFSRAGIPFVPTSIQRVATDQVGSYNEGRYLVTNGFSGGEASGPVTLNGGPQGFGGEVLELGVMFKPSTTTLETDVSEAYTLGRPSNTSPLIQPAFAYRLP